MYEFFLSHSYPLRYPHLITKRKTETQEVTGWQGLEGQALTTRCCDTWFWSPIRTSEERTSELRSKGCENEGQDGVSWESSGWGRGKGRESEHVWPCRPWNRGCFRGLSWGVTCPYCL